MMDLWKSKMIDRLISINKGLIRSDDYQAELSAFCEALDKHLTCGACPRAIPDTDMDAYECDVDGGLRYGWQSCEEDTDGET